MAKKKTRKKKEIKPIFWLAGNYYDTRKIWKGIVQMTTDSVGDPNIVTIECGFNPKDAKPDSRVAEAADVRRLIRMKDIFDTRPRIIRMVGLPPDYSDILDYLKFISNDNVLVIDSPIGYYKQKSFVSAGSSKFYKYIKENGKVFNFDARAGSHKDAVAWVLGVATDHKRKISKEAVQLLVETKGLDFDTLYCETLKLFDYTDDEVSVDDIKECCIPVFERAIWEFIEQLNRQRYDDACRYVEEFINDAMSLPASKRHGLMEQAVGALTQNFETLIHAKDRCKSSLSYGPFWDGLDGLKKLKDKEWVDKFTKGACFAKIKDGGFQLAYGWPKSKIYGALLIIRHLHPRMRFASENWRCSLTAICMYICGKLTERQALMLGGYAPDEVDGIVGVG